MGSRIIELRWKCRECDSVDILGRHKQCPNCGAPRDKGEMRMDGLGSSAGGYSPAASVSDPELLDLANAGRDWFCTHCDSGNKGDVQVCSVCGAPRYDKAAENLTEEFMSEAPDPVADVEFDAVLLARSQRRRAIGVVSAAIVGALITMLVCGGVWAMRTYDTNATVTALAWHHDTVRQTWTDTVVSGWQDEVREVAEVPPRNGEGERAGMMEMRSTCAQKHHHDESYVCGTHEECTTNYRTESYECGEVCSDNGNGFATCTPKYCTNEVPDGETCRMVDDYCDRPIYETWCDYGTQEWRVSEVQSRSGAGKADLSWAEPEIGELDRVRWRARYDVLIPLEEGEEYRHHPGETLSGNDPVLLDRSHRDRASEAFLDWDVHEQVVVRRMNIGPITAVVRADGRIERSP